MLVRAALSARGSGRTGAVRRCTRSGPRRGRIVEDERVFGGIEFGLGSQGSHLGAGWDAGGHTDGTVLNPSITLDGVPMEVEGRYVHPEVVAICQGLGVPGY